jgi:hypothetical protein
MKSLVNSSRTFKNILDNVERALGTTFASASFNVVSSPSFVSVGSISNYKSKQVIQ